MSTDHDVQWPSPRHVTLLNVTIASSRSIARRTHVPISLPHSSTYLAESCHQNVLISIGTTRVVMAHSPTQRQRASHDEFDLRVEIFACRFYVVGQRQSPLQLSCRCRLVSAVSGSLLDRFRAGQGRCKAYNVLQRLLHSSASTSDLGNLHTSILRSSTTHHYCTDRLPELTSSTTHYDALLLPSGTRCQCMYTQDSPVSNFAEKSAANCSNQVTTVRKLELLPTHKRKQYFVVLSLVLARVNLKLSWM